MAIDFACKRFELEEVIKCGLSLTKSDFKVMMFLINDSDSFTSQEISKKINLELSTVQRALKKLNQKNIAIRGQKNLDSGGYVYFYKSSPKKIVKKIIMDIVDNWSKKVEKELNKW